MRYLITSLLILCAVGCTSGLSSRETRTQSYSSFILSLYDNPTPQQTAPVPTLPMKIAVAQVGESAPTQIMLAHLREKPELFARIEGIPGLFEESQGGNNLGALNINERQMVRERVARLQRLARDMGMDYLFLYGGSMEHYVRENALEFLDLTIVGAFIFPSRQIRANGKAAGALIDARSGSIVFIASADTEKTGMATASNRDGEVLKVLGNARESLNIRLADQLAQRCQEIALTRPIPYGN